MWAIDQVFPIAPIERLDERPERRGVIADLTCDSDGKIDTYVENEDLDSSLPLHELRKGESYRLGFFLVGAYQEILGDIHNLFGDTDAIEVRCEGDGHRIVQPVSYTHLDVYKRQMFQRCQRLATRVPRCLLRPGRLAPVPCSVRAGVRSLP